MKKRRDPYQRTAYAERRMSLAIDRVIRAQDLSEKATAKQWAMAWKAASEMRRWEQMPTFGRELF